ncbi:MAG TPA: hypothetical protein VEH04_19045 [Verrucomicrobiae bacterium]|nr:hypothetical protein [Verrucomicrobiae bacterium]
MTTNHMARQSRNENGKGKRVDANYANLRELKAGWFEGISNHESH